MILSADYWLSRQSDARPKMLVPKNIMMTYPCFDRVTTTTVRHSTAMSRHATSHHVRKSVRATPPIDKVVLASRWCWSVWREVTQHGYGHVIKAALPHILGAYVNSIPATTRIALSHLGESCHVQSSLAILRLV